MVKNTLFFVGLYTAHALALALIALSLSARRTPFSSFSRSPNNLFQFPIQFARRRRRPDHEAYHVPPPSPGPKGIILIVENYVIMSLNSGFFFFPFP